MSKEHEHKEKKHAHEECDCNDCGCGHEHGMEIEKDFNRLTMEEVVYGNQHVLNILLDILIEKGIISEQELKDKLDAMIEESEEVSNIKFEVPEDEE
ncbi:MAG: hypothetical protein ACP5N3_02690 [Candidatus Nanoarchaeia archaeon]